MAIFKERINRREPSFLQLIVLLTLIQLFIALLTNGFALSSDEAMWHYIGRNWFRNGLVPYSGGVDNHSPLIFAVFGLSDKLFGVNYWFPRLLGTLCQSVGVFYIYKSATHIAGKQAGLLAMSLYGLSVMWHGADGRYTSYTETYEVMFMIISFYFFVSAGAKKRYFISGFFAAIGMGFRLSGVFGIIALFIASFNKTRNCTLAFCLGVLSGMVFLGSILLLAGINFREVYLYGFGDNFGRGSTTDHNFLWRATQFHNLFFYSEVILFYPLAMAYVFINRRVDWLVLWAIFEFAGINIIGNYARVDLKGLLPPLSLMGSLVIARLNVPLKYSLIVIWVCFSPKIVEPILNFTRLFTGEFQKAENYCHEPVIQPDESAGRQLGLWIRANTKPQEKVLVAGYGSQVQVYSERISPGIYFNATQTQIAKDRFYRDLSGNEPEMILVPLFPEYQQYIDADLRQYIGRLVAKDYYLDRCMFNYNVYRIKK